MDAEHSGRRRPRLGFQTNRRGGDGAFQLVCTLKRQSIIDVKVCMLLSERQAGTLVTKPLSSRDTE